MARKARIENGRVAEIMEATPFPPFHPSLVWVDCDADVREGWQYANGFFSDPTPPRTLADAKVARLAALAAHRYKVETAGIAVGGAQVLTDPGSQAKLSGAVTYLALNPTALIDWKGATGWVQLNKVALETIALAVAAHVQACFSNEKVHADAINALTDVAAVDAYDFSSGWPL